MTPKYMRTLRREIDKTHTEGDLRILVHDLGVDWDHLRGEIKPEKIQDLILHIARQGRLLDMVELLREERPHVNWENPPPKSRQIEDAQTSLTDSERDAALQAYLDDIKAYVEEDVIGETTVALVQAYTDRVWPFLDLDRKNIVIRLLIRTGLVGRLSHKGRHLVGVDLRNADLDGADFYAANLEQANLMNATLKNANLFKANLQHAILIGANLEDADLQGSDLERAILFGANLEDANLNDTDMRHTVLLGAMLTDAELQSADLTNSYLVQADLRDTNIEGFNIKGATVWPANLSRANLTLAKVVVQQLKGVVLDGETIMPNGAPFEGWDQYESLDIA